ncbi:hypothetical protein D3C76_915650 [compost metagenome]
MLKLSRSPRPMPRLPASFASTETPGRSCRASLRHQWPATTALPDGSRSDQVSPRSRCRARSLRTSSSSACTGLPFTATRRPGTMGNSGSPRGDRAFTRCSKASFSAGSTFSTKWLGASAGSCSCQVSISSPRSRATSAIASRIRPKARLCPAAASGCRSNWPRPRRQGRLAWANKRRRPLSISSRAKPSATAASMPPASRARVRRRSRLSRHMIRPSASSAQP